MSRIGKQPIKVPSGVKITVNGSDYNFVGPQGNLNHSIPKGVMAEIKDDHIYVTRDDSVENAPALHGLTRTLMANCVHGVAEGFTKVLEINGVGYRAAAKGQQLNLTLGYSHPVVFDLPQGITAKVEKNTVLSIIGADKQMVGEVAAKIKAKRPVEPYQGKGIRYRGEHVIRKQGKAAGSK